MKTISIPDEMYRSLLILSKGNKKDYTNNETKLISDFLCELSKNDDDYLKKLSDRFFKVIPVKNNIYNYFKEKLYEKEAKRENITVNEIREMVIKQSEPNWEILMLYFTCLISMNETNKGLFNIFNLWYAYPNGPIEVDCYNIDYNKNYKEGALFVEWLPIKLNMLTYPFTVINDYEKIINESLDILYSPNSKLKSHFTPERNHEINIQYLIYLSHDLYLWRISIERESRELDLLIPELLKEKEKFLTLL